MAGHSAAWDYHAATKHYPGAASPRRVDAALIPKQYKRYVDLRSLTLPPPRSEVTPGLRLETLATLLHYSLGIVRRREIGGRVHEFRAASCTGAAYHIEAYVVCGSLDGLDAGVYHYDVRDETLRRLRTGDFRGHLAGASGLEMPGPETFLVLTSTFWRNAWRYGERAYRHAFWDAGTITANLLELAAAGGHAPRLYASFLDDAVNQLLGLDARKEAAVAILTLGSNAAYAEPPTLSNVAPAVEPLSEAEIEYPLIWRTHAATASTDATALRSRRSASNRSVPAVVSKKPLPGVIERRVSTRRFRDEPLSRGEFDRLLSVATSPLPSDFPALSETYAVVHAVEGLGPGVYRCAPGSPALIRGGILRAEAGHAALDQPAAALAAANLYFVARLDQLLAEHGERGYRAAQLEGGVRGGRVYLQATALGLRATGLTFYDDVAAELIGADPEETAVLFLIAVGH
jgi:SagB-type dehydrogenase family enzyme